MSEGASERPYQDQLAAGFRGMRFAQPLESEFHEEFTLRHLWRTRIGLAAVIALYGGFTLLRLSADFGVGGALSLKLRLLFIGAMALVVAATFVKPARFVLPWLTLLAYAAFAAGITGLEIAGRRYGLEHHYEGMILGSFHLYLFSGLLFRKALTGGVLMFAITLAGGLAGGLAGRPWSFELLFIGLSLALGAAALYSIERVERESFLKRRIYAEIATTDSLTGLFNRLAFFEQYGRLAAQAARDRLWMAVALLDVDHFKAYNDRYGHVRGDACLREVARALKVEFRRPSDIVGRYGGEEFIGLFYDVQPEAVRALGEQLRATVQALRIEHAGSPTGRVTVSVGVATFQANEGEAPVASVQRADRALYQAKERGRNRVIVDVQAPAAAPARGRRAPTVSGAG